jgi:hypothetical protein
MAATTKPLLRPDSVVRVVREVREVPEGFVAIATLPGVADERDWFGRSLLG